MHRKGEGQGDSVSRSALQGRNKRSCGAESLKTKAVGARFIGFLGVNYSMKQIGGTGVGGPVCRSAGEGVGRKSLAWGVATVAKAEQKIKSRRETARERGARTRTRKLRGGTDYRPLNHPGLRKKGPVPTSTGTSQRAGQRLKDGTAGKKGREKRAKCKARSGERDGRALVGSGSVQRLLSKSKGDVPWKGVTAARSGCVLRDTWTGRGGEITVIGYLADGVVGVDEWGTEGTILTSMRIASWGPSRPDRRGERGPASAIP